MGASTRRAALGAILAAPLASAPACASTASNLAVTCVTSAERMEWVCDPNQPLEDWPDDRMDAEIDRFSAVLERSIREPSADLRDLAAKAKLVLCDQYEAVASDYIGDRALTALLREVIKLCA